MWSSERRALLRLVPVLGIGSSGTLAGCGFALRRPVALAFTSVALVGFEPRSAMAAELRRRFPDTVRVLDTPAQAQVVLRALLDGRDKVVVASTAAAQVREVQLRLRFEFRADTPGGRELIAPSLLVLTRDLSYRETAALAKEHEEAELRAEMQVDAASQVLRRLGAVRL